MNTSRWLFTLVVCGGLAVGAGCAKTGAKGAATPTGGRSGSKVIVTPGAALSGKVARANMPGQYVVVTFPVGPLPAPEQKLVVYRASLKVGEIRISRQQIGQNLAADILTGEIREGDEVRLE